MSNDLTQLLNDWPFEPGQLAVRVIEGDDGVPRIQLRVDLGILQMEVEGRPDGLRPNGHESLLELFESKLDEDEDPEQEPSDLTLDSEACKALREEAVQYYHRYVAMFALQDYEGVIRDTSRNLRVMSLCAERAESEEDRHLLDQFRPYVLMMRSRAQASQAVQDGEPKSAMLLLDDGLDRIREHFDNADESAAFESSNEAQLLAGMRDALSPKLPQSPKAELRERLRKAVEQENYELAAILRDELKMTKG